MSTLRNRPDHFMLIFSILTHATLAHAEGVQQVSKKSDKSSQYCPSTISVQNNNTIASFEIKALKDKIFTKAELEQYLESLETSLKEAEEKVKNGGGLHFYYNIPDMNDKRVFLYGCDEKSLRNAHVSIACYDISYYPKYQSDTLTPRIKAYQCHKMADWPTATDGNKKKIYNINK